MHEAMLKIENLSVSYGGVQAVREISLEVRPGEIAALLGANGAGKSSTLLATVGSVKPKAGRVIFEGRDITGTPPDRLVTQGIAMIPEGARVFARQPVEQNLGWRLHGARRAGLSRAAGAGLWPVSASEGTARARWRAPCRAASARCPSAAR